MDYTTLSFPQFGHLCLSPIHFNTDGTSRLYSNSVTIVKVVKIVPLWVPLVVEQSRGALEGLGAEVAAVWSLIVVAPLVMGEPGRPPEALPTIHTQEGMVRLLGLLRWVRHRGRNHVQNHLYLTFYYSLVSLHHLVSVPIVLAILSRAKKG